MNFTLAGFSLLQYVCELRQDETNPKPTQAPPKAQQGLSRRLGSQLLWVFLRPVLVGSVICIKNVHQKKRGQFSVGWDSLRIHEKLIRYCQEKPNLVPNN